MAGGTTFVAASLLLVLTPFVAATAAVAQDAAPPAPAPAPEPASSGEAASSTAGAVSLHPFVANALDRRKVARTVETGAPGGDTYVEHVPRAFGLTFHSPF